MQEPRRLIRRAKGRPGAETIKAVPGSDKKREEDLAADAKKREL
jgi:hypothetical protein